MIGPALSVQEKALRLLLLRPELLSLERFELRLEERLWVRVAMETSPCWNPGCSTVGAVPPFLLGSAFTPPFGASVRAGWTAPGAAPVEGPLRSREAALARVHSAARSWPA